jgi:hypothetical protein
MSKAAELDLTNRSVNYRNLRIACSVLCGIVAVLLVLLWIRSYSISDKIHIPIFGSQTITSVRGTFSVTLGSKTFQGWGWEWKSIPIDEMMPVAGLGRSWSFRSNPLHMYLLFPHRYSVLIFTVFSLLPWYRGRFSVRALLTVITLVCFALGVAIWLSR